MSFQRPKETHNIFQPSTYGLHITSYGCNATVWVVRLCKRKLKRAAEGYVSVRVMSMCWLVCSWFGLFWCARIRLRSHIIHEGMLKEAVVQLFWCVRIVFCQAILPPREVKVITFEGELLNSP